MAPRRSFPSVRLLLGLTLILTSSLLLCLTIKSIFSATAAHKAVPIPAPTASAVHRAAPVATLLQTASTLLSLRFENTLNGEQGEVPTQSSSVTFQPGISGQGLYMDRGNRLIYDSSGNIDAKEGTIELWMKPSWNGNDGQNHALFRYGNTVNLLLGNPLPAAKMEALGLIARCVAPDQLETEAGTIIDRLVRNAPLSLRAMKATINRQMTYRDNIEHVDTDALVRAAMKSADAKEGVSAHLERRTPNFRGV